MPPFCELLKEHSGVSYEDEAGLVRKSKELGLETKGVDRDNMANNIFEQLVEQTLNNPTFVLDYPTSICPLTKTCEYDPRFAQRFELYIASMEVANSYSELNDALSRISDFVNSWERRPILLVRLMKIS